MRLSLVVAAAALLGLAPPATAQRGGVDLPVPVAAVRRADPLVRSRRAPLLRVAPAEGRRRARRFALVGALVGGVGGFAACRSSRRTDVTPEARSAAAVACGMFGALLGVGVGVGLAAASERGDDPPMAGADATARPDAQADPLSAPGRRVHP